MAIQENASGEFVWWVKLIGFFLILCLVIMLCLRDFSGWWRCAGNWGFLIILIFMTTTFLSFLCLLSYLLGGEKTDKKIVLVIIVLICASVLLTDKVNEISQGKEAAIVEYEKDIKSVCLKAIDSWRQSGIEIDQYRTTDDIWKFFSGEHGLEGRYELELVTSDGGYRVVEDIEAVAYIMSSYKVVGTYELSGITFGTHERTAPAAVIVWEVFLVDLGNQVVTAHTFLVGFPDESVELSAAHWEDGRVIGRLPTWEFEKWIASLPISRNSSKLI